VCFVLGLGRFLGSVGMWEAGFFTQAEWSYTESLPCRCENMYQTVFSPQEKQKNRRTNRQNKEP
jgi:hypothetical protein